APRRNQRSPPRPFNPLANRLRLQTLFQTGQHTCAEAVRPALAYRPRPAMACVMRAFPAMIASAALLASPCYAIVGGATPSNDGLARAVVTIVGSRGNFCTGSWTAPALVLPAAHCVQPGAEYKIVEYDAARTPELKDVKRVAIDPGFQMQAMLAHRATADVALLQLEIPAKGKIPAQL